MLLIWLLVVITQSQKVPNVPWENYEDNQVILVNLVVVMTSLSGTAYMGGQRRPEEMRNSTRL